MRSKPLPVIGQERPTLAEVQISRCVSDMVLQLQHEVVARHVLSHSNLTMGRSQHVTPLSHVNSR